MVEVQHLAAPADAFVAFGISGDLARKMTFVSLYQLERRELLDCPVIGVAVDAWTDDDLRTHAADSIAAALAGTEVDKTVVHRLQQRMVYVGGDFADSATFERVKEALGARSGRCSIWRSRRHCSRRSCTGSPTSGSPLRRGWWWRSRSVMT